MLARASGSGGLAPGMAPIGLGGPCGPPGDAGPPGPLPIGADPDRSGPPPAPTVGSARTPTATMRSGSGNGSGRSATASTTEKIAVVAPVPNASTRSAPSVKLGVALSARMAWRRSMSDAVERERARRARRRRFVPVRLAQGSEEGFESGTVELGPRRVRRLFGRRAARRRAPATDPRGAARAPRRSPPHERARGAATRGADDVRFPVDPSTLGVTLSSSKGRARGSGMFASRDQPDGLDELVPGLTLSRQHSLTRRASADRSGAGARPPSRPTTP